MTENDARELTGDLKQHERLNRILEVLTEQGRVSVHDAVEEFGVSGATIRRDLDHLASRQLLRRTRGGAVAMLAYDVPLGYKADKSVDARQRIGSLAAEYVQAGQVVGIAGGQLALETARALGARADFIDQPEVITVLTNAVNIAYELSTRPHIKLVVTGGAVRSRSFSMTGETAKDAIRRYRLDHLFVEVDGVTEEGASVRDDANAEVLAAFVARSRHTVALAELAAVDSPAFAHVCDADRLDAIVTDSSQPDSHIGGVPLRRV
ncbi:DeoR/GlpR family DNA-binding transcription regulator [Microbacterium sp. PMB16]|uniref:DeoR/GlpR family DNA-binding transcription regulator n=1 Tax=Microbacterium sp. PMB16 TaxID=3120157 RepID=UPI003F4B9FC4